MAFVGQLSLAKAVVSRLSASSRGETAFCSRTTSPSHFLLVWTCVTCFCLVKATPQRKTREPQSTALQPALFLLNASCCPAQRTVRTRRTATRPCAQPRTESWGGARRAASRGMRAAQSKSGRGPHTAWSAPASVAALTTGLRHPPPRPSPPGCTLPPCVLVLCTLPLGLTRAEGHGGAGSAATRRPRPCCSRRGSWTKSRRRRAGTRRRRRSRSSKASMASGQKSTWRCSPRRAPCGHGCPAGPPSAGCAGCGM